MTIMLYQNSAEIEKVEKSKDLTLFRIVQGTLKEDTDVTNPTIEFVLDVFPNFNYAYIVEFNRYYFLDSRNTTANGMWECTFSLDPLMTFKAGVKNLKGFIDRNEFEYDESIVDTKLVMEVGYDVQEIEINNLIFNQEEGGEILPSIPSFVVSGFGVSVGKTYS